LKIVSGNLPIEITTGTPNEQGAVPKYYLKFPDDSVAAVYKSGILKSVSDRHSDTIRTLGGSLVALEPDVKSGGYITSAPTQQQLERFTHTESRLDTLREIVLARKNLSITRHEQFEYEREVPSDDDIAVFFGRIKSRPELDAVARQVNKHLGAMDIVHPDIGDRDYLAFSFYQGSDGGCVKCNFQHLRKLVPRAAQELQTQIDFYKKVFSHQERSRFDIFAGNHRGLGIDFALFLEYVSLIKNEAGMSGGRVFAFCNAEDILRLHDQYGTKELESTMLGIGLHLNLGVESGSPAGLKAYGKNINLASIKKALTILKNMKVRYSVNVLAGVMWENHVLGTVQLFRALYRPGDNRPAVYSSEFKDKWGHVDEQLEKEQYAVFRTVLNDCGIYVFRYTFIPFNKKG
jgi:hypothetical protein